MKKFPLNVESLDQRMLLATGLMGTIGGIAGSPEAAQTAAPVPQAYTILLSREADAPGLAFWQGKVDAGEPLAQVDGEIALCPEFSAVNITAKAQVDALYLGILGRSADAEGEAFWIANTGGDQQHATTSYQLVTPPGAAPLVVEIPGNMTVYKVNSLGIPQVEYTPNLAPESQFPAAQYDVTYQGLPTVRMDGADARAFDSFIPDTLKADVTYAPVAS